jgi:hypothetical protein
MNEENTNKCGRLKENPAETDVKFRPSIVMAFKRYLTFIAS